mgnify:CR=1 FL=1
MLGMYATGPGTAGYYVIGNAVMTAAMSGVYGVTITVDQERWEGTLVYLFGAPVNRFLVFFGRAFIHLIDGFLGVVMALGAGALLFGVNLGQAHWSSLVLTILAVVFSTSGFGLLVGSLSLRYLNGYFFMNFAYLLLLALTGVNFPVTKLPLAVQWVASGLPLTRGVAAARLAAQGAGLSAVAPLLAGELVVGLAYLLVGYAVFLQLEVLAKRLGTLERV